MAMSAQGKEHGSEHIPTVVEFTLAPSDRGVMVRVVETGFAEGDDADAAARAAAHRDNSQGWDIELTAARAHLERV